MINFPKDCNYDCKHYSSRDMSVDDYLSSCKLLGVQVNDYDFRHQGIKCPLTESEDSNDL